MLLSPFSLEMIGIPNFDNNRLGYRFSGTYFSSGSVTVWLTICFICWNLAAYVELVFVKLLNFIIALKEISSIFKMFPKDLGHSKYTTVQ